MLVFQRNNLVYITSDYRANAGCWVFLFLYIVFYSLFLILVQLTLLSLVVYGSTVSAPCCLVVLFHSKCFMLFCLISLHYVNGINKLMVMMKYHTSVVVQ